MDICVLEVFEMHGILGPTENPGVDMSMRSLIKPPVFGGPLPAAAFLSAPHREQQQDIAGRRSPENRNPQSELARFAATRSAARIGYGALAFWIVVAALVAARIAFLDPGKIEPTASLFGTKAMPAWTTGGSPSPKN
jgi:hypothetical protein